MNLTALSLRLVLTTQEGSSDLLEEITRHSKVVLGNYNKDIQHYASDGNTFTFSSLLLFFFNCLFQTYL